VWVQVVRLASHALAEDLPSFLQLPGLETAPIVKRRPLNRKI
jgi:hypothetical protein